MDPLRDEFVETDTCVRCPHCNAKAWFVRPKSIAATVVCPAEDCGKSFVWDRWLSRENGLERATYLHPKIPNLLECVAYRSWEITGIGVCLLVFAVPPLQSGLATAFMKVFAALYFGGMATVSIAFAAAHRSSRKAVAANATQTRTRALERGPTVRAVGACGWAPLAALQGRRALPPGAEPQV